MESSIEAMSCEMGFRKSWAGSEGGNLRVGFDLAFCAWHSSWMGFPVSSVLSVVSSTASLQTGQTGKLNL
jgi:hypothetical protein